MQVLFFKHQILYTLYRSKSYTMKFDFYDVENIKFECQKNCGKCCSYELIHLTTADIKRINDYIEKSPQKIFQNFLINTVKVRSELIPTNDDEINKMKKRVEELWYLPLQGLRKKGGISLIFSYVIWASKETWVCPFQNLSDFTCYIYPVRPFICKAYPFIPCKTIDEEYKITVDKNPCPGLCKGMYWDKEKFKEIFNQELFEQDADFQAFQKYKIDNGFKPEEGVKTICSTREKYYIGERISVENTTITIIEPFVEMGLIPRKNKQNLSFIK